MKSRIASEQDIPGILQLQEENLFSKLSPQQREKGFVTTPFTIQQIEDIIALDGLFVTENQNQIIAYAFAGTWEYFKQWEIFPFMTSRFPDLSFQNFTIDTDTTFQYGPVCVEDSYRGQGVFSQVFEAMRLEWIKKYPLSVTFINAVNAISAKAHEKLGWVIIDRFSFNGNNYLGLVFDMKQSVI